MTDWFYARDGQQVGPISITQLKVMLASGQLRLTDLVWTEGMAGWSPPTEVPELLPIASSPGRPQPPPLQLPINVRQPSVPPISQSLNSAQSTPSAPKKTAVRDLLIGSLVIFFMCGGLCVFMCSGLSHLGGNLEKLGGKLKPTEHGEFMDHTDRYKGKTVTLEPMRSDMSLGYYQSVAKAKGEPYLSVKFTWAAPYTSVRVDVPLDLEVPNSTDRDALSVTFECTEGSREQGNIATKISRWP